MSIDENREMDRIRVLQCVNTMDRAGLETMLMNYYRAIDRTFMQFDFLVHRDKPGEYDEEIKELGGHIFVMPRLYPQNYWTYINRMTSFLSTSCYRIVHSHIDAMSFFPLLAAKRAKIWTRIAHSHSTSIPKDYKLPIKLAARKGLPYVANSFCACSDQSGQFLFGKEWEKKEGRVIKNAIDMDRFVFSALVRSQYRKKLNIGSETLVIGHIGRFTEVKNHKFLTQIFCELLKRRSAILLLIGEGGLQNYIREILREKGILDKVVFLGSQPDVSGWLNAMDIMVMPSIFEGEPLSVIEAQATGLPVLVSEGIPENILWNDTTCRLSLDTNLNVWCKTVLDLAESCTREFESNKFAQVSGYSIKSNAVDLQNWYRKLYIKASK